METNVCIRQWGSCMTGRNDIHKGQLWTREAQTGRGIPEPSAALQDFALLDCHALSAEVSHHHRSLSASLSVTQAAMASI